MNSELQNKKFGFKRFLASFKNSFNGLKYAYLNEQSLFIHALATILAIILGCLLKISLTEWLTIMTLLVMTAILELLNTAIESVCDAVTLEKSKRIKVSKDTASAAVFLSSLASLIVGLLIFVPKIIALF